MKYIRQFLIIVGISFLGEFLKTVLPFPVPASIYGMGILFLCLMTGRIRLEDVRETGKFLIEIMPVMFIPAGVGLMESWGTVREMLVPVILITVLTNLTVMFAAGRISQIMIRREGGRRDE